jgi:AcrR family transcriptional regulator
MPAEVPRPSRAQKNAATMRALLDAAAQTFVERGFEAASMDEIAGRVGLTKGALYYRFPTKQDLFLALLDERCAAYVRQFHRDFAGDGSRMGDPSEVAARLADALQGTWPRLFIEFVSHANRHPRHRRALRSRMAGLRRSLAQGIEQTAQEAAIDLPVEPSVLALAIIIIASGWSLERLADPRGVSEELLRDLLSLVFAGAATRAPVEASAR